MRKEEKLQTQTSLFSSLLFRISNLFRISDFGFRLFVPLCVAGCMVGPNYQHPDTKMPAAWVGTATTRPTTQGSLPVEQQAELARWWTVFGDPQLDSLINRAIENNLDLQQAAARV